MNGAVHTLHINFLSTESLIPKIELEYVFQVVRNEMDLELITYKKLFKKLYFFNYWAPSVIRASLTSWQIFYLSLLC